MYYKATEFNRTAWTRTCVLPFRPDFGDSDTDSPYWWDVEEVDHITKGDWIGWWIYSDDRKPEPVMVHEVWHDCQGSVPCDDGDVHFLG